MLRGWLVFITLIGASAHATELPGCPELGAQLLPAGLDSRALGKSRIGELRAELASTLARRAAWALPLATKRVAGARFQGEASGIGWDDPLHWRTPNAPSEDAAGDERLRAALDDVRAELARSNPEFAALDAARARLLAEFRAFRVPPWPWEKDCDDVRQYGERALACLTRGQVSRVLSFAPDGSAWDTRVDARCRVTESRFFRDEASLAANSPPSRVFEKLCALLKRAPVRDGVPTSLGADRAYASCGLRTGRHASEVKRDLDRCALFPVLVSADAPCPLPAPLTLADHAGAWFARPESSPDASRDRSTDGADSDAEGTGAN